MSLYVRFQPWSFFTCIRWAMPYQFLYADCDHINAIAPSADVHCAFTQFDNPTHKHTDIRQEKNAHIKSRTTEPDITRQRKKMMAKDQQRDERAKKTKWSTQNSLDNHKHLVYSLLRLFFGAYARHTNNTVRISTQFLFTYTAILTYSYWCPLFNIWITSRTTTTNNNKDHIHFRRSHTHELASQAQI